MIEQTASVRQLTDVSYNNTYCPGCPMINPGQLCIPGCTPTGVEQYASIHLRCTFNDHLLMRNENISI